MLILENPGMSDAELAQALGCIRGIESINVFRQIVKTEIAHLSFAVVKLKTPKDLDNFIKSDSKLNKMTAMKLDGFYLSKSIGLITGLKQTENVETYVKTFMENGAQSIRFFDPVYATNPFCCVVSFNDDSQYKTFKSRIDGLVIGGSKINISHLRHQMSAVCSPKMEGIKNVLSLSKRWDFTIYHYEKSYKCWSGAAYALSEVMREAISKKKQSFEAPNILGPFQLIINFLHGESIDVNASNAPFLLLMGEELKINLIVESVKSFMENATDPFTLVSLISAYNEIGDIPVSLIHSAASLFETIKDMDIFNFLPVSVLEMIISSPAFLPDNEESLFHWVLSFLPFCTKKFKVLIRSVRISSLSKKCILEFLDLPPSLIDLNEYRLSMSKISSRAKFPQQQALLSKTESECPFDEGGFRSLFVQNAYEFDGINLFRGVFYYFFTRSKRMYDKKPVEITASGMKNSKPDDIINYNQPSNYYFETPNINMSWIRVVFNYDKVSITGYSIKTHNVEGNGHLVNWRLSGSNNGNDWEVIDNVSNSRALASNGAESYFKLKEPSKCFSMFELRQMRTNSSGFYIFRISRFELFGAISSYI